MTPNLIAAAMLSVAAVTLAACEEGAPQAEASSAICRPDAAEALAGRDRLTDEQAMQLTGATIVRQIRPGQAVTMDYRQERVTVETDPATGKILRAGCG